MPLHTARTRDAALRRLAKSNRWLIAGSAALTGVFTAVAANAFPGHTLKKGAANTSAGSRTGGAAEGESGSSELRSPSQAPEAGSEPGAETSETAPGQESSETAPSPEEGGEAGASPEGAAPPSTEPEAAGGEAEAPVVSGGS